MADQRICSVDGCEKPAIYTTAQLCGKHYKRVKRHGANATNKRGNDVRIEWLRNAIKETTSECVLWPFSVIKSGYGKLQYKGHTYTAHRLALILHSGDPASENLDACHLPVICHNKLCVNVKAGHVFWDTRKANMNHKHLDGTQQRGQQVHNARLTEQDIIKIRNDRRFHSVIAAEYNVSQSHISAIINLKKWKHV